MSTCDVGHCDVSYTSESVVMHSMIAFRYDPTLNQAGLHLCSVLSALCTATQVVDKELNSMT